MEALDIGVERLIHFDPVGIELQLRGIQQRLRRGEAGHYLVHGLDEVDDIDHRAVGHGGGDVPRYRVGQGGAHVGESKLLLPRPLAVQDVSEALDHDMPRAQHVGQLSYLLGVGDGLVKGVGKIVAAQDGQIGVVAFQLLVAVAVDHRQVVVVVLLADKTSGILAEGPDLILERPGPAHQLGLVQHAVHRLHDLVAHLYPHADIHRAGLMGDAVLGAQVLQPVRPPASRGDDRVAAADLPLLFAVGDLDAQTDRVLQDQVGTLIAEQHLHAVLQQMLLDGVVELLGLLRAQVADGTVYQLQARADSPLADGLDLLGIAQALHMAVGAELQVYLVRIINGLLRLVRADEGRQVAAHLIAEGQLPVGESARAGKAGGDMAVGLAVDAPAGPALGTPAVLYRAALLHDEYLLLAAFFEHLQRGKDPGGARADDDDIWLHR